MSWALKAILATASYVPFILAIGFMARNYGVRSEATFVWFVIGIIIGTPVATALFGVISVSDLRPSWPHLTVAAMGAVFGIAYNFLLVRAIEIAPNPGMPVAIANTAAVVAFVLAPALAALLPRWFESVRFDAVHFIGIILAVAGVVMIVIKR